MGLFKRLHRITIGRIERLLSRAEDPEVLFPQLVCEMEQQLRAATEAEAKARAAHVRSRRDLDRRQDRLDWLGRGAAQALRGGDESTARGAIEAQIDCERLLVVSRENLDRAQDTVDHASAARQHIHRQLQELRARKDEILTRARVARAQKRIQGSVAGSAGSTESILEAVARLEEGVQEIESQLQVQADLNGDGALEQSLERRLRELDIESEVNRRLGRLREQVGQGVEG